MFYPEPHKNTQRHKAGKITFEVKQALLHNLDEEQVITPTHVTPIHVTPTIAYNKTTDLCNTHSLFQELYLWLVARLEAQHRALQEWHKYSEKGRNFQY